MTRINLGILPAELCDQHLLAEYRELPRVAIVAKRHDKSGDCKFPELPTLGTGHVLYFVPYGKTLQRRWEALRAELVLRDFSPTLGWRGYPWRWAEGQVPDEHIALGRTLLMERIRSKLRYMDRLSWTKRPRPDWTLP